MTGLPKYELVLTGGPAARVPLPPEHLRFFAAVADSNPPKTAVIAYTPLDFPARLKAELRESLKREGITVVGQQEVSPEELDQIYSTVDRPASSLRSSDIDFERYRDIVMALLSAAVSSGASDIHIVRRRRSARVSFRINGQIVYRSEWGDDEADNTCRFIYDFMAQDQAVTWNPRAPQDAVIDTSLNSGARVRVRVGTIPASPDGYDMVLRVLPALGDSLPLQQLGYSELQLSEIRKLVHRPSGLVVMAGGVGSGKSTSLIGMLHEELEVHEQQLRIITVEDPPERIIPNATQVPVIRHSNWQNQSAGDEFLFAIRGALRCDPDTLMVGEIRDRPAAQLVIKFAQSGHRVYTTLHTNSALGVVGRLVAIGIDPALLCTPDVLKGMIYQTLVPVLCESCRIPMSEESRLSARPSRRRECVERLKAALSLRGLGTDGVSFRGPGCEACGQSGIAGRTLIPEIVIPDDDTLRFLAQGDHAAARRYWLETGGQPVIEHGIRLIEAGRAAPDDVEWRIGQLDTPPVFQSRHTTANGHAELAAHA